MSVLFNNNHAKSQFPCRITGVFYEGKCTSHFGFFFQDLSLFLSTKLFVPNEFTFKRCLGRGSFASPQLARFRTPSRTEGPSNFTQQRIGSPSSEKFFKLFLPINFTSTCKKTQKTKLSDGFFVVHLKIFHSYGDVIYACYMLGPIYYSMLEVEQSEILLTWSKGIISKQTI